MSLEGPETRILADQMNRRLAGHEVVSCDVHDVDRLQRSGFVNHDLTDFQRLIGGRIDQVISRGNTIRVSLDNETNLIVGPEYGGRVLLHTDGAETPEKTHALLHLDDGRVLSIRLTGMGALRCDTDDELDDDYVYRRDFSDTPDPTGEGFDYETFDRGLARSHALKTVLVGKDASIVGISNSAFQDILYRAGIHPKRKAAELTPAERQSLHNAIRSLVDERAQLGGKTDFIDLHGIPGRYEPLMGPTHKDSVCERCGSAIASLTLGGGRVYFCPGCQR